MRLCEGGVRERVDESREKCVKAQVRERVNGCVNDRVWRTSVVTVVEKCGGSVSMATQQNTHHIQFPTLHAVS